MVSGSTVDGVHFAQNGTGVSNIVYGSMQVKNSTFSSNGTGIDCGMGGTDDYVFNTFSDNAQAINFFKCGAVIRYNKFSNNDRAISGYQWGGSTVTENDITGSTIAIAAGGGINNTLNITGNSIHDNQLGIAINVGWSVPADQFAFVAFSNSNITGNSLVHNGVAGLCIIGRFGPSNVVANNAATGNGFAPGGCDDPQSPVVDDGIYVNNSLQASGAGVTLSNNVVKNNADYGIEAVSDTADGGGNTGSGNGNTAQCIGVDCTYVPGAPSVTSITGGNALATVTFDPPTDNGGAAIAGYRVTCTSSNGGAAANTVQNASPITVTGLTNGKTYTCTVQARNAKGYGSASPPSASVMPATTPSTPTSVAAFAENASALVTWSPPTDNGGLAISGYTVSASPGNATREVDGSTTRVRFDGLLNGTSYTFQVVTRNALGPSPSVSSNAVTLAAVPGAPGNVLAIAGNGMADVSWVPPTDTGGSAIDGYTVIASPGGQQANVAPTATSATLTGLTNGTTYTFVVRTHNTNGLGPPSAPSNAVTPTAPVVPVIEVKPETVTRSGYWMLDASGNVYSFGDAKYFGGAATAMGPSVFGLAAVHVEPTPSGNGYWIVDNLGRVYSFGDAPWLGNADRSRFAAGERVSSLSATPSGRGYWIFTSRGRVLPFGDAVMYGDMAATQLNGPVLGSIATPSGKGYYMVASDGEIFAFGDAVFYGSMGGTHLNAPVQSLVPTADGKGYWLVASDGGIFAFGDATFRGSMGSTHLNRAVVGMVRFGDGYLTVGADGGIFDFSDQPFLGSLGNNPPATGITSVATISG